MTNQDTLNQLNEIEEEIQQINKHTRGNRHKYSNLAELHDLLIEKEYKLCRDSLYAFLKTSWKTHEGKAFIDSRCGEAIAEHIEACYIGEIQNLLVNVPPRTLKTSVVGKATHPWLWANDPTLKFITCGYSYNLSVADAVTSRQIITSEWYREGMGYWGKYYELSKDSNKKEFYTNTLGGYRLSTSVGGVLTGKGADWIIVDDILNANDSESKVEREKANLWFSKSLSSRLNDQSTGITIVISQRLHELDLPGYILELNKLLEPAKQYVHLSMPMLFNPKSACSTRIGFTDWRTTPNEILEPDRFKPDDIEALKVKLTPYPFSAQYQQDPAPIEGGMIKADWFRSYYVLPQWFDALAIAFDLSMTDSERADETGAVVVGRSNGKYYVLEAIGAKMDVWQQVELIQRLSEKYPLAAKLVEAKANGQAVMKLLENAVPGLISIQPTEYGGSKEGRVSACIPTLYSNSVYLPPQGSTPWFDKFMHELLWFPKAKDDNILDAFIYAILYLALKCRTISMPIELTALRQPDDASRLAIKNAFSDSPYSNVDTSSRKQVRNLFAG